jgi:D-alanine-D-alanine ligase
MKKNLLMLCGGGGTEHEISIQSAKFIESSLKKYEDINLVWVEITKSGERRTKSGELCELRKNGIVFINDSQTEIKCEFVIPCLHGFPGETGHIPALLELMAVPFYGCRLGSSVHCFNKITTKLWLDAFSIPNTPFEILTSASDKKSKAFFQKHGEVFVKAANQGSSVGCFHVQDITKLESKVTEAFKYSNYVLLEKVIKGRELEISAYEFEGKLHIAGPGEIVTPKGEHYTYEEKYSEKSNTQINLEPEIDSEKIKEIHKIAINIFKSLKLTHLSRIDFFLEDSKVYVNEINTFPGMTEISLFPKLMEKNGHSFAKHLYDIIQKVEKV